MNKSDNDLDYLRMEFIIEEVNKTDLVTIGDVFKKKIEECVVRQRNLLENIKANIL